MDQVLPPPAAKPCGRASHLPLPTFSDASCPPRPSLFCASHLPPARPARAMATSCYPACVLYHSSPARDASGANLPLHGDAEEHDEVHHQDGPEHRDVERLEEGADHGHQDALGGRVPETKERSARGQRHGTAPTDRARTRSRAACALRVPHDADRCSPLGPAARRGRGHAVCPASCLLPGRLSGGHRGLSPWSHRRPDDQTAPRRSRCSGPGHLPALPRAARPRPCQHGTPAAHRPAGPRPGRRASGSRASVF